MELLTRTETYGSSFLGCSLVSHIGNIINGTNIAALRYRLNLFLRYGFVFAWIC